MAADIAVEAMDVQVRSASLRPRPAKFVAAFAQHYATDQLVEPIMAEQILLS